MYRRKIYGQSKIDTCPFCEQRAITKNNQQIPTCLKHKDQTIPDLKCVCGQYLDLKAGKYGPFFTCMNCGNINFKKALEINPPLQVQETKPSQSTNHQSTNQQPSQSQKTPHQSTQQRTSSSSSSHTFKEKRQTKTTTPRKEITITSDELDFL